MGLMREKNLEDEYSRILDDLGLDLDIEIETEKKIKEDGEDNTENK